MARILAGTEKAYRELMGFSKLEEGQEAGIKKAHWYNFFTAKKISYTDDAGVTKKAWVNKASLNKFILRNTGQPPRPLSSYEHISVIEKPVGAQKVVQSIYQHVKDDKDAKAKAYSKARDKEVYDKKVKELEADMLNLDLPKTLNPDELKPRTASNINTLDPPNGIDPKYKKPIQEAKKALDPDPQYKRAKEYYRYEYTLQVGIIAHLNKSFTSLFYELTRTISEDQKDSLIRAKWTSDNVKGPEQLAIEQVQKRSDQFGKYLKYFKMKEVQSDPRFLEPAKDFFSKFPPQELSYDMVKEMTEVLKTYKEKS